jgi:hypothetical protein
MSAMDMELIKSFARRIYRGNFLVERATAEERDALRLAPRPVTALLAQDYMVWRRAVMWGAVVFLGIHTIFELINWIDVLASDPETAEEEAVMEVAGGTLKTLLTLLFLISPAATALMVMGALHWTDVKRSRHWARLAWMVMVLTPMALALVPWRSMVSEGDRFANVDAIRNVVAGYAFIFLLMKIAPLIIGISSGIVRSSLILRTLLPESPVPGWIVVLFAPLYCVLFICLLVGVVQFQGGFLILFGMGALLASQLLYLRHVVALTTPCDNKELERTVLPVRNQAVIAALIGGALIIAAFLEMKDVDFLDILRIASTFGAGFLTIMVVGTDLALALIQVGYRQGQAFHGSALSKVLEEKVTQLEQVGLHRVSTSYETTMMKRPDIDA